MKKHFFFYGSWTGHLWTFRVHRCVFQIKGPRCQPLFSERYGYRDLIVPLGFGWRFIFDKKEPIK